MARVSRADDAELALVDWEACETTPNAAADPSALEQLDVRWVKARAPGTYASALRDARAWSFDSPRDFDAIDVFYRCAFKRPSFDRDARVLLRFGGLATIADVWLNGEHVLRSDNMFHEHAIDVTSRLRDENAIMIKFAALKSELAKKRPRPRYKTKLVRDQQLRFVRATLLGRIPAWSPPVACVGPWRGVTLEEHALATIEEADLRARIDGEDGIVEAKLVARAIGARSIAATLHVGDSRSEMTRADRGDGSVELRATLRLPNVARWWPHTHGAQPRHDAKIELRSASATKTLDAGKIAFRTIDVDTNGGAFRVIVNGVPIFCRGACWTTNDIVTLGGSRDDYAQLLAMAKEAGMNMLRVGGTMIYESNDFYDLCDELGVLVWQDFMFANMDYPFADEPFVASVKREAAQFLSRTQTSPCLAVSCGNSEGEQQAAMLGLERSMWSSPLFAETLPSLVRELRPDVFYWPSSASGGALPFHPNEGTSSYYGVGAYMRDFDDARRSDVRFTTECLAFANVPCDETIESFMSDGEAPPHHPKWKQRVPRDAGPGWDFDDVRDHYFERLFAERARDVRYADLERYLAMSRAASAEAMRAAFAEWRRHGSRCDGALVWFLKDLWPGAGWGVVDAHARPKAAYYALKRMLQPIALAITDEGLNGLRIHAINETDRPLAARLALALYREGETRVAEGEVNVDVPARGKAAASDAAILGRFVDATDAYRFGPAFADVAVATLVDGATGARLAEAFHFPLGFARRAAFDAGLVAMARQEDGGVVRATIRATRLASFVEIDARGFVASDQFFHVAPHGERCVTLRPCAPNARASAVSLRSFGSRAASKLIFEDG